MKRREYIKKIMIQKILGLAGTLGSIWMACRAANAVDMVDKDCTAILFILPICIYFLVTNKAVIELD